MRFNELIIFLAFLPTTVFSQESLIDFNEIYSQPQAPLWRSDPNTKIDRPSLFALQATDDSAGQHGPPSLTPALQVGGGVLLGGAIGLGFGLVGVGLLADCLPQQDADPVAGFLVGAYTGYVFGTALGAHKIGEKAGMESPLAASIIGGVIGSATGYWILSTTKQGWGMFVNPPVFATLSFHLNRADRRKP